MKKQRIAFLISTIAGSGEGKLAQSELPKFLHELGLSSGQYQIHQMAKQDAVRQAAEVSQNTDRLIAVGGDGTAAAAIAGVHASGANIPVGVIPLGIGNDLARVMNIHKVLRAEGLKACVAECVRGEAVPIDIWWVNRSHLMVNYLSIGVDAGVVNLFNRNRPQGNTSYRSPFINRCIYALLGIAHVFTYIKGETIVHLEGTPGPQTLNVGGFRELVISNIAQYAGGTLIAPDADYVDRRLDITPFSGILGFVGLFLFPIAPRWQRWYGRKLTHYTAKEIQLHSPPENYLQIDGEDKTFLLQETHTLSIEHAGQALIIRG